jgi:hypothetical protein
VLEWGVWAAINGAEVGDGDQPEQSAFFVDLLTLDTSRFPLTSMSC